MERRDRLNWDLRELGMMYELWRRLGGMLESKLTQD